MEWRCTLCIGLRYVLPSNYLTSSPVLRDIKSAPSIPSVPSTLSPLSNSASPSSPSCWMVVASSHLQIYYISAPFRRKCTTVSCSTLPIARNIATARYTRVWILRLKYSPLPTLDVHGRYGTLSQGARIPDPRSTHWRKFSPLRGLLIALKVLSGSLQM